MNEDLKIKVEKDDGINCIMSINYFSNERNIFTGTADVIRKILNESKIDQQSVNSIKIIKKNMQIHIKLGYSKINFSNLISNYSQHDQIIKILNLLGYLEKDIIDISSSIKSEKESWKVRLHSNEIYNNKFTKNLIQLKISKEIAKDLGINAFVTIN